MNTVHAVTLLQAGIAAGILILPALVAILALFVSLQRARFDESLSKEERKKKVGERAALLVAAILFVAFIGFLFDGGCNDGPLIN